MVRGEGGLRFRPFPSPTDPSRMDINASWTYISTWRIFRCNLNSASCTDVISNWTPRFRAETPALQSQAGANSVGGHWDSHHYSVKQVAGSVGGHQALGHRDSLLQSQAGTGSVGGHQALGYRDSMTTEPSGYRECWWTLSFRTPRLHHY